MFENNEPCPVAFRGRYIHINQKRRLVMNADLINQNMSLTNRMLDDAGPVPLHNMGDLAKILKRRNDKLNTNHKSTFRSDELSPKLRDLADRVKKAVATTKAEENQPQVSEEDITNFQSELYCKNFAVENHASYMKQHNQYVIKQVIKSSFQQLGKNQKKIKDRMKKKMLGYGSGDRSFISESRYRESGVRNVENQAAIKKQKYLNFVRSKVLSGESLGDFDELAGLESRGFWHILQEQIKSFDYALSKSVENPKLAIIKTSIDLLQGEFSAVLPDRQREIDNFMHKTYMSSDKVDSYQRDSEGYFEWAIAYAFLRSGRYHKLYSWLSHMGENQIRNYVSQFVSSLAALQPQPVYVPKTQCADPFYQQIVSILSGDARFSDWKFFQPGSLDLVWVILISLQLYSSSKAQKHKQFKAMLKGFTEAINFTPDSIKKPYEQFLYLSAYTQLIDFHINIKTANQSFNDDDFIHFLLVLLSRSEILEQNQYESVEKSLEESLVVYIRSLMKQNISYVPFYLMMLPSQSLQNTLEQVIQNCQDYFLIKKQQVDGLDGWSFLKQQHEDKRLPGIFQKSLFHLVRKLLKGQRDPLIQLEIIVDFKSLITVELYLHHEITIYGALQHFHNLQKHCKPINSSFSKLSLSSNQEEDYLFDFMDQIPKQNSDNYEQVITFLKYSIELYHILRNTGSAYKVKQLDTLLQVIDQDPTMRNRGLKQLVQQLIIYEGVGVYFDFVRNLDDANSKVSQARANISRLTTFQRLLLLELEDLKQILFDQPGYQELVMEIAA